MAVVLFDGTKPFVNYSSELFEEHFCEIILNSDQWFRRRCRFSSGNGVARTLKTILHTSKRDYWIKPWFSSFGSLFKMGTFLKERFRSQRERILSFKSSSLWYGNKLYHRWPPLKVAIFITHVCICVMGATPMSFGSFVWFGGTILVKIILRNSSVKLYWIWNQWYRRWCRLNIII